MFQNQTFRQKLSYAKNDNNDQTVSINITLSANHEIEKDLLKQIEAVVSDMFIKNYTSTDDIIKEQEKEAKQLKEEQRLFKEQQKQQVLAQKQQLEAQKLQLEMHKQNKALIETLTRAPAKKRK